MRALVGLWIVLAACHPAPDQEARDVCTAYCDCIEAGALPSTVASCIDQQCLPHLPAVSNACLDCVYAHDQVCTDLYGECNNLCLQTQTQLLGGS